MLFTVLIIVTTTTRYPMVWIILQNRKLEPLKSIDH